MHRTALLASTCLSLALIPAAHAVDGTWIGATGAWTTGINWSTGSVPGSGNTATFTSSGATTAITISGSVSIGTIQLDAGAPAFSFTTAPSGPNFTINGTGIVNNSSNVPTFTVGGGLIFSNSSSAGNAAITNNNFLHFSGDSTAGNATLTNNNGATSFMFFSGNGTAGNATIINNLNSVVNFSSNGPGGTGNTAGSISGAGSYVLNGNRLTTGGNNATTTVSGVISGSGGQLAKAGTGTLTLSGTNTYTGATTINAGVLNVATIGNGGVAGNLGQASNAAANLVLSGGTLRYTGATASTDRAFTLTAGTTSTIDVAANNLTISGASAATTGALIKIGNGTLTFTGANTYTGGTTISAGTLQIGNGGTTGSIAGDILNNATLAFNRSNALTYGGVISGNGALQQNGSGNTTLNGTNTYTGPTTVNAGGLIVNGSIALSSALAVNSGASVGGDGNLPTTSIGTGGTLSPGNSIGTINVLGNLVFTAASTYLVEINPGASDRTNVTGTATLGGATVSAIYAGGSYISRQYTLISAAGGVVGTFNSLVNSNLPANFTPSLTYDANNAYLNLTLNFVPTPPGPTPPGPTPSGVSFRPLAENQRNVAGALINSFNTVNGIPAVFGMLTPQGLTHISGEHATGTQQTTFDAMDRFLGLLTDPFLGTRASGTPQTGASGFAGEDDVQAKRNGSAPEHAAYAKMTGKAPLSAVIFERRWSVWSAGHGGTRSTDGNAVTGSQKLTNQVYGSAAGFDYRITPETMVGFALGGAGASFGVDNGLGGGRSEMFQAGLYGRHILGPAYITGALAWGWQDITIDRNTFGNSFRAEYDANALSGRIEGGYRIGMVTGGIAPYAAGQFTTFRQPDHAEQLVAGVNTLTLAYSDLTITASRSELGLRGDTSFAAPDAVVTLRARAAWAHNFNTDRSINALFQTLPESGFTVFGAAQAGDGALMTASADAKWLNGFSVAGTFEGEFSRLTDSYAGKGIVRYQW